MSTLEYIFLPEIPFVTEAKSKEEIASVLNERYPEGKFDSSKIIISRKDNKYNAYAQTTKQHEKNLLDLKLITIGGKNVFVKNCFPHHQIYINKLSDSLTKQDIESYFGEFGKIVDIELFKAEGTYQNSKQKLSSNHCYVRFADDNDAEKCLFWDKNHTLKTKETIRVVRAYKVGQNDETDKKLFLRITPVVPENQKLACQKQLMEYLRKYGELRQKIRIEQISNQTSKAIVTFTSIQAGEKALQDQEFRPLENYSCVLRPFASKQNCMAFLGGLKPDTTEEKLKSALEKYGKIVSCTINPSKKAGVINAVATFSDQQTFKLALSDYKSNQELVQLFLSKPYMDIHMTATVRNDYNNFKKKDKKPTDNNMMNMGGIGIGFGYPPQRMNQPPQQPFIGGNQGFGFNPLGNSLGMGLNPPNLPSNMGNLNKMMPPPPMNRPL